MGLSVKGQIFDGFFFAWGLNRTGLLFCRAFSAMNKRGEKKIRFNYLLLLLKYACVYFSHSILTNIWLITSRSHARMCLASKALNFHATKLSKELGKSAFVKQLD